MSYIFFIILGTIIGSLIVFLYLYPKVKATQKVDEETQKQNLILEQEKTRLNEDRELLNQEITILTNQKTALNAKKAEILNSISDLKQQAKESSDALYEQSQMLMAEKMDIAAREMSEKYQKAEDEAKNNYLKALEECSASITEQISEKEQKLIEINAEMDDLHKRVQVALIAYKRQQEMAEKQDFYRLQLSDIDIKEIQKLREVSEYLRDQEPLNKVIWKTYYEKPYTDLIGRVIGSGAHTGIYKITNIKNHMCYVGQAVNIGR